MYGTVVSLPMPVTNLDTLSRDGLCLNHTNGKDNHVRLRTSSRTIGEDGSKPNPNPKPKKKKETKERNLEKGERKRENLQDSNSQTPKLTVPSAITQPTVPDGNLLQTT